MRETYVPGLPDKLRTLRREAGLTQQALADAVNQRAVADGAEVRVAGQSTVAHWETGRSEPSLPARRYIAEALGTDHRLLFQEMPTSWAG